MNTDFIRPRGLDSVDAEYGFGRPKVYLAPHELARLIILRSRLGDTRAERLAHGAGRSATPTPAARIGQCDLDADKF